MVRVPSPVDAVCGAERRKERRKEGNYFYPPGFRREGMEGMTFEMLDGREGKFWKGLA